jgi:hypothetical protein
VRIAYIFIDHGHKVDTAQQRKLARISMASVRKHMPGVEIIHLSDMKTKTLEDADSVICMPWDGHNNRGDFQAQLHGDMLFLDTDTIIMQDVSNVFDDKSFEVAVARRGEWDDCNGEFNQGVVFSRQEKFWKAVAEKARTRGTYDEVGFSEVVNSGAFRIKLLEQAYNFSPPPGLAIFHFKGARKSQMLSL